MSSLIIDKFRNLISYDATNKREFVQTLGMFHYLLSRVVLAERGSSWMYETLMMAIAFKKGYSISFNPDHMVDVLAIAHPNPNHFAKLYERELVSVCLNESKISNPEIT